MSGIFGGGGEGIEFEAAVIVQLSKSWSECLAQNIAMSRDHHPNTYSPLVIIPF